MDVHNRIRLLYSRSDHSAVPQLYCKKTWGENEEEKNGDLKKKKAPPPPPPPPLYSLEYLRSA